MTGKRFYVALAAIAVNLLVTIAAKYGVLISPEIQQNLIELITLIAVAYIGGQSYSDVKLGRGSSVPKNEIEDEEYFKQFEKTNRKPQTDKEQIK